MATKAPERQAAPPRSFRIGTQSHEEISYDKTATLNASTQDLEVLEIPPAGYLRGLYIIVEASSASNAATVALDNNNAPFSVFDSITFEDTNAKPILGPVNGYDLYLINKYGGYFFSSDPKASPNYTATTGTTTPATFNFILRVPIEIVARDALGSLPNKSGTNKFKLRMRLAAESTVYSTAPTNDVSVRVRVVQEDWWEPNQADFKGRPLAQNPPAMNTTQFWTRGSYAINSGDQRIPIQQGLGYPLREFILINYPTDSSDRTSTTDGYYPDPARIQFEATTMFNRPRIMWREMVARQFGYTGTVETANGRDYSVYPYPFMIDFGLQPGADMRRGYLSTSDASRFEFQGSFGGASNLTVLMNYVAPAGGDDANITM